jgi:hypothetical protein
VPTLAAATTHFSVLPVWPTRPENSEIQLPSPRENVNGGTPFTLLYFGYEAPFIPRRPAVGPIAGKTPPLRFSLLPSLEVQKY